MSFEAKKFVNATKIGFFRGDDPTARPGPGGLQLLDGERHDEDQHRSAHATTAFAPSAQHPERCGLGRYRLVDPGLQRDHRKWSPKGEALGVRVGEAVLECDAGSTPETSGP